MSAVWRADDADPAPTLRAMSLADLDAVLAIEQSAYGFPWSRGNFIDSIAAGYVAELLCGPRGDAIGYFVAMTGVDELHLLNITVAPAQQRRGLGRLLLEAVQQRGRALGLRQLWLEVRAGNARARALYAAAGFEQVGLRRHYYPAAAGREDAVVMRLALDRDGETRDVD